MSVADRPKRVPETRWEVTFESLASGNFVTQVVRANDPDDAIPNAATILAQGHHLTFDQFGRSYRLIRVSRQA